METKHLDLGCGLSPKNPFNAYELYGCDIRDISVEAQALNFKFKQANLALEPIPYPDNFFTSVSAFDFIEHIPRQIYVSGAGIKNSFIELMNEISRVLKPGGQFVAVTPVFPHTDAFTDPTHVNVITTSTHKYFIGDKPSASIYGFVGEFKDLRSRRDDPSNLLCSDWRAGLRRVHRNVFRQGLSHMIWHFESTKR